MQKEVTIYDLAKTLNLSPATISRGLRKSTALNEATVQRILAEAEKRGYRHNSFASSLRNKRSQTLGIIVPRLNSYFMATVLAGMEDVASKEGYHLIISQSLEKKELELSNAQTMFNKRVDGLMISLSYDTDNIEHLQPFFDNNIPVIFFDRAFPGVSSTSVVIDNYSAAYQTTKHLIASGCSRIMHLAGDQNLEIYQDRLRGYQNALKHQQISLDNAYVYTSKLSEEDGIAAAAYILSMPREQRPDAVFAANDMIAAYCMANLIESGIKVPEEIAFAGFNNDAVSRMVEPQLTTINYPGYDMGKVTVSCLINLLKGDTSVKNTNKIILHANLMERKSSSRKQARTER
jgi:LacI family transcriptional regulator